MVRKMDVNDGGRLPQLRRHRLLCPFQLVFREIGLGAEPSKVGQVMTPKIGEANCLPVIMRMEFETHIVVELDTTIPLS